MANTTKPKKRNVLNKLSMEKHIELRKWLEENKDAFIENPSTYKGLATKAELVLGFSVAPTTISKHCEIVGIPSSHGADSVSSANTTADRIARLEVFMETAQAYFDSMGIPGFTNFDLFGDEEGE